jgi:crotonobetainyl-CoA:carnitine CoA-transferase CaiB-like acyl-CoA transferase
MTTTLDTEDDERPLAGIRVVDLTQYEAGPSATQVLAWLGADVIKVEPPKGDPSRYLAGGDGNRDSMVFLLFNQSKRSVVLDLTKEAERERLQTLLRSADVMAENFAPGTLGRLGLDVDRLRRDFPRLVVASIRGYAAGGPWSDYKSLDMVAQAVGGGRKRLERRFRAALDRTVHDEIRRAHVDMAKTLLETTNSSLIQVAKGSGFRNAALLSVAFHRDMGMPPGLYRRRVQSELGGLGSD